MKYLLLIYISYIFLLLSCGEDTHQRDIVDIRISKDKLDLSAYTECIYPVTAIEHNLNYQIRRVICQYNNEALTTLETVYTDSEPQNEIKHKKIFKWFRNQLIIDYYDYKDGVEMKTTSIILNF